MSQFELLISGTGLETRQGPAGEAARTGHIAVIDVPEVPRVKSRAIDRAAGPSGSGVPEVGPAEFGKRVERSDERRPFQYSGPAPR